jgi:hypothetical protein
MSRHVAVGGLIVFGTTISLFAKIGESWRERKERGRKRRKGRRKRAKRDRAVRRVPGAPSDTEPHHWLYHTCTTLPAARVGFPALSRARHSHRSRTADAADAVDAADAADAVDAARPAHPPHRRPPPKQHQNRNSLRARGPRRRWQAQALPEAVGHDHADVCRCVSTFKGSARSLRRR